MQTDIIYRIHAALPSVRHWIDDYLEVHADQALAVDTLGFERLNEWYPQALLQRAKAVTVGQVLFPPVHQFGLPEFAGLQQMEFAGITFKDTFFLQEDQLTESLHFHELAHVVQWARLGVDNFLLAYGVGLLQSWYEDSPLEQMAYTLQDEFDRGAPPRDLVPIIEDETDSIWREIVPLITEAQEGA